MGPYELPSTSDIARLGASLALIDSIAKSWGVSFELSRHSGHVITGDGVYHENPPYYTIEFKLQSFQDADGEEATYEDLDTAVSAMLELINVLDERKDEH